MVVHLHRRGDILLQAGVNVFAFDYRGYGRSEGKPGEEGTYRDAQAAHAWLGAPAAWRERVAAVLLDGEPA